jgi:hypothetical protein
MEDDVSSAHDEDCRQADDGQRFHSLESVNSGAAAQGRSLPVRWAEKIFQDFLGKNNLSLKPAST